MYQTTRCHIQEYSSITFLFVVIAYIKRLQILASTPAVSASQNTLNCKEGQVATEATSVTVPAGALLGRVQNCLRHLHSCTLAHLLSLSSLFPLGGLQDETKIWHSVHYTTLHPSGNFGVITSFRLTSVFATLKRMPRIDVMYFGFILEARPVHFLRFGLFFFLFSSTAVRFGPWCLMISDHCLLVFYAKRLEFRRSFRSGEAGNFCLRIYWPYLFYILRLTIICNFHCFTVHFDSLSFIHTNSCTFSYNYVSVF